ncbi:MAG: selenide, water dikinase SelD [Proteobacteria bacterium]|nr:selenide, water dikinase SelD [Pseudomonadota bacterium]
MSEEAEPPIEIVLVGGGHSHVQVLRAALMAPFPGARLTLIVDDPIAVYSGMVPGVVSGQYSPWDVEIDVRPLAKRAGARIIVARAERIDADEKRVYIEGRPPIRYDICSVNVGSTVAGLDTPGVRDHAVPTRPIAHLVHRWQQEIDGLQGRTHARVVVVGAGAGGVELAFCARERLIAEGIQADVTLLTSAERVLDRRSPRAQQAVLDAAAARGITVRTGARVHQVREDAVVLDDGELPADVVFWVTGAVAKPLLAASGFETDARGFAWVDGPLQLRGHERLFAVGDCALPEVWPEIPKAGVYAVREGPVLIENLRRLLRGTELQEYTPQKDFLTLLNLGDGTAIGTKWGLVFQGSWAFKWKDHIDRVFMHKFQVLDVEGRPFAPFEATLPPMPPMEMVCGGCAAKVGQTALERALADLGPGPRGDEIRIGVEEGEDAAVIAHGEEWLVQSIDAFTAFTDDPWLVGRVAALNSISDVEVSGAVPRWAMALVNVPSNDHEDRVLGQVMRGARAALDAAGVALVGGHSTVGEKLSVGFSITGTSTELDNASMHEGQVLVLTRALGTGVLWRADGLGQASGRAMTTVTDAMLRGNGEAARMAEAYGATAMTDITGFGLASHLAQLCRRHEVSATVFLDALPAFPTVETLLGLGVRSTFHEQNRDAAKALFLREDTRDHPLLELIFDPQTAGGLVASVPAERAEALIRALEILGEQAARIGQVTPVRSDGAALGVERSAPADPSAGTMAAEATP